MPDFIYRIVSLSHEMQYVKSINSPEDFKKSWVDVYNKALTLKKKKLDE